MLKSWSVWHRIIAFFIDIDDIDTFSAVLLPFCLHSVQYIGILVTRYYFLPLGRTGLHDWNVHSTFSHCDLRTFGASEEIVTSGEVGFVLLILLIVHCWDTTLWIGVFQFVDVPNLHCDAPGPWQFQSKYPNGRHAHHKQHTGWEPILQAALLQVLNSCCNGPARQSTQWKFDILMHSHALTWYKRPIK